VNALAVLWEYRQAFVRGLLTTAELVVLTATVGTVVAILLEWLCHAIGSPLRRVVDSIAFGVSAIPALVILFWLYYPAQAALGVVVSPFWTALIALSLVNVFAVYRILADSLREFPKQFVATGLVSGLSRPQIASYIQLPLLLRATLPRWIDQQVVMLQTSLFASLISVEETFRVAQRINSREYRPVVIYTSMALLFLATAGTALYYARHVRLKAHRDFSER
jgi:ABC-type amino acid transport system permease subunit